MKIGDIIRDYTESDPAMKNYWNAGGQHVRYRVLHIGKDMVNCLRLASPEHTDNEFKNFKKSTIKKVSQTIGIYEVRSD